MSWIIQTQHAVNKTAYWSYTPRQNVKKKVQAHYRQVNFRSTGLQTSAHRQ
jgi:hypothetical protein